MLPLAVDCGVGQDGKPEDGERDRTFDEHAQAKQGRDAADDQRTWLRRSVSVKGIQQQCAG